MSIKGFSCFSSGGHFVQQSITILGSFKERYYEIILKLGQWPTSRCCLKVFLFFSSGGHFVQRSKTILAILVEGHPRNITVK